MKKCLWGMRNKSWYCTATRYCQIFFAPLKAAHRRGSPRPEALGNGWSGRV